MNSCPDIVNFRTHPLPSVEARGKRVGDVYVCYTDLISNITLFDSQGQILKCSGC